MTDLLQNAKTQLLMNDTVSAPWLLYKSNSSECSYKYRDTSSRYITSELILSKAWIKQHLKIVRGSQDILCFIPDRWQASLKETLSLWRQKKKKHFDQKKQNTKLKQTKKKASVMYNTKSKTTNHQIWAE